MENMEKPRLERDHSNPCDTGAVLHQLSSQTNWELPWESEVSFGLDFERFRGVSWSRLCRVITPNLNE